MGRRDVHTHACQTATDPKTTRARNTETGLPDPYPLMSQLTEEGREAVLTCHHWSHDVVRQLWQRELET